MSKKVFTGENQNLPQLAKDVEDWLRQQGFEVQAAGGDGTFLVQARKQSTWRSLLGNNQSINVKIEGMPENYSIDLDAGEWVKNLTDSGGAGIVAALATMYTLGIAAAWSASERSKIEAGLWAQKDASCPACVRIGATVGTGEKFVRAEAITLQASGVYQGTKVFTDTFKCRFCSHAWDRGEKQRVVSLCPKCYDEKSFVSTGKTIIACNKTDQRNQQGQPLGEEVYKNHFKCNACSHSWEDGPHSALVEVCPSCLKKDTREATGAHIFSCKKTNQRSTQGQQVAELVFTNIFKCKACAHAWNDGQRAILVEVCPHCEKPGGIVFLGRTDDLATYVENYQCKFCAKQWNTGKKDTTSTKVAKALDGVSALFGNTEMTCPRCQKTISRYALRCPFCTSDLTDFQAAWHR